jgi:hypothetical protein
VDGAGQGWKAVTVIVMLWQVGSGMGLGSFGFVSA